MKLIVIACYFIDSEEFVAKLVINHGFKCGAIRKIIDPVAIITGRTSMICEKYEFYGKIEVINELEKFLQESDDYDVEIIEEKEWS